MFYINYEHKMPREIESRSSSHCCYT